MKLKSIFVLAMCVLSGTIFAVTSTPCPSTALVKNTVFKNAFTFDAQEWRLISNPLRYSGHQWMIKFDVTLLDAKDPVTAMRKGQDYFDHALMLPTPIRHLKDNDVVECSYSPDDAPYKILAVTPPRL